MSRVLAPLLLAILLATAPRAEAQDWERVYRGARTANVVSYAAPAVGFGLGVPLWLRAANAAWHSLFAQVRTPAFRSTAMCS